MRANREGVLRRTLNVKELFTSCTGPASPTTTCPKVGIGELPLMTAVSDAL